ncbi:SDR family oxidoreductase [Novosphingobium sp. Gsoil 351]|uniref:SDR family oxidoreductase n=1 Tax=Novosphingobium sp. Gsoil 351 TaxID=2675225 RepID=UPI0012B4FAB6|nr:SDR family oxidoreductase [Novosphingobium sp. Gsoil 351]QGN54198.1 SDR family oxidoreductase [Novosphingobium sp. Gsoil 351]
MSFSNRAFRLDGKVAIVTGAGGRGNSIGRAYAMGLAQAGSSVVVADLNEDGARRVASEIGEQALPVKVDIADEASVAAMMAATQDRFGGLDILVNNAALMVEAVGTPAIETEIADFERLLKVNLLGALICTKAAVPFFEARGGGKIVNQLSAGAWPAQTPYGVSKIALHGLTITLATELGPLGINVNAIAPGMTMSDAGKALTPDDSPFVKAAMARVVKQPRGLPDDLVGALLLLCSPAGDWITGQALNVDGGFVLRN